MARRKRRQRARPHLVTEIELMPMLNVFISIIPLLLLSAAFVPVTVIKTTMPTGEVVSAPPDQAPLDVAVVVTPGAFVVRVDGAAVQTVPRPQGTNDSDARGQLEVVLKTVADAHPGHREVRIVSEASTRYEEIVEVMDTARAAGLPEAALADASTEVF
jgi:biopolymer transport protein ExbD